MKLDDVELLRIRLPLVTPFRTPYGVETDRDVLLVRVRTTDGVEGWGECVATQPPYSDETIDGAQQAIGELLVPRLWDAPRLNPYQFRLAVMPVPEHPMAKAAIEMAVLDAYLRTEGVSLAGWLGAKWKEVPAGVSVGIADSVPELLDQVEGYMAEGYARIKLKIQPGWDIEPVEAVRKRFPTSLMQVDANEAYESTPDGIAHLCRLDEFDLLLIEQPFGTHDMAGHAALARKMRTRVCLDESIVSPEAAERAIGLGACEVVNIKLARVAGISGARAVHEVCKYEDVPAWCGGMLETGIGRAANVALAALSSFKLPGDTSASRRYWHRDVTEPFVLERNGTIRVPTGPGLGVTVDQDFVDSITHMRQRLPRRTLIAVSSGANSRRTAAPPPRPSPLPSRRRRP